MCGKVILLQCMCLEATWVKRINFFAMGRGMIICFIRKRESCLWPSLEPQMPKGEQMPLQKQKVPLNACHIGFFL